MGMIDTRERPQSGYLEATAEGGDYEAALQQLQGSLEDRERLLSIRLPQGIKVRPPRDKAREPRLFPHRKKHCLP